MRPTPTGRPVLQQTPTPSERCSPASAQFSVRGLAVVAALVSGLAVWAGFFGPGAAGEPIGVALSPVEFEATTGIRITRIGLSGGDGIVDIRYQVLDPDKAVVVHDKNNPPALVEESTHKVFGRSWHSHTRRAQLRAGGSYYFLLLNERHGLDHGSTVSVKIGNTLLPNVTVR
jgi:hypothetical protein